MWALVEERVVLQQAQEEVEVEPAHMEVVNQQLEPRVEALQLEQVRLQAQQESSPLEEVQLQLQRGKVELLVQQWVEAEPFPQVGLIQELQQMEMLQQQVQ